MKTKTTSTTKKSTGLLDRVRAIGMNFWWTWNDDAQCLFGSMDPKLYDAMRHNPLATLNRLSEERQLALQSDPLFEEHLVRVEKALADYLAAKTWFARTAKGKGAKLQVAYFCAEFAIHESFPQYSGGLGVLAGDHLKSASDLGVPLVAVGMFYNHGFYTQQFNQDGSTKVIYPRMKRDDHAIADTGRSISLQIGKRTVRAKIWNVKVGRTNVYLLDTNVPENTPADRTLTQNLYGGNHETRIQQELLLGVGGVMALDAVGVQATVFHMNEGHAAFATLERVSRLLKIGKLLEQAKQIVQRSSVFTTHTPVPAGNDRFDPKLSLKYLSGYADKLGISTHELMALGREVESDKQEPFCMTVLALKLAEHRNGVAALHGETSRGMWTRTFNTTDAKKVPIGHITNGIHSETWLAREIRPLYDKYLKPQWVGAGPSDDWWKNVGKIPPSELWETRRMLRQRMVRFIRNRLIEQRLRRHESVDAFADASVALNPDALTIGFARRFATYKRGALIFRDANRLAKILSDPQRPVQLVFAGKAHPADLGGQSVAQTIFEFSRQPKFKGRVILLEDYDMEVGRMLTSGCDVWLNNPLRPLEASGTSGMKPPLHGGINCSILDGWWPEGFNRKNGWAIDGGQFKDEKKQAAADANAIYTLLENEIVPDFYERGADGLPKKWLARSAESMRTVCNEFSTARMVGDYTTKYYLPANG